MTERFMLAIELGPVQEFIAAARKTRDLWFGSWMLSELAKAAAKAVADACGGHEHLVFPAPMAAEDLKPESALTVADVILAVVPSGVEHSPAAIADQAKQAAHQRWLDFADEVEENAKIAPYLRLEGTWKDQTRPSGLLDDKDRVRGDWAGEVIECYAAWTPLGADYAAARRRVMQLLAGRTACRNFPPVPRPWPRVSKSSLDGARETVLADGTVSGSDAGRPLRLSNGEQLDAPGLVKRHCKGKLRYPSLSRVAADPWLRGAKSDENFDNLRDQCDNLAKKEVLDKFEVEKNDGGRFYPRYKDFPYEGTAVYRNRHHELIEEKGLIADQLKPLQNALAHLTRQYGDPDPYLAVIAADGDRIGTALDQLDSRRKHRKFSQQLDRFAGQARTLIEEHQGVAVFVGGDDVLAFLPVDQAIHCARKTYRLFQSMLAEYSVAEHAPTLSVGIAIGHFLEAMEDLLAWAHDAERLAKEGNGGSDRRDGLAISYRPRGGAPVTFRQQWSRRPDRALLLWSKRLRRDKLPDKAAYDLLELAHDYDGWSDPATLADAIRADALRLLSRKSGDALARLKARITREVRNSEDIKRLSGELLIARRIARCQSQAGKKA